MSLNVGFNTSFLIVTNKLLVLCVIVSWSLQFVQGGSSVLSHGHSFCTKRPLHHVNIYSPTMDVNALNCTSTFSDLTNCLHYYFPFVVGISSFIEFTVSGLDYTDLASVLFLTIH